MALGQIAEKCENMEEAHSHFQRAAAIMDHGNYYRVTMDLQEFKDALFDAYARIALRLGKEMETPRGTVSVMPKKIKVGRNAPCPCGSGKKYKKCCIGLQG